MTFPYRIILFLALSSSVLGQGYDNNLNHRMQLANERFEIQGRLDAIDEIQRRNERLRIRDQKESQQQLATLEAQNQILLRYAQQQQQIEQQKLDQAAAAAAQEKWNSEFDYWTKAAMKRFPWYGNSKDPRWARVVALDIQAKSNNPSIYSYSAKPYLLASTAEQEYQFHLALEDATQEAYRKYPFLKDDSSQIKWIYTNLNTLVKDTDPIARRPDRILIVAERAQKAWNDMEQQRIKNLNKSQDAPKNVNKWGDEMASTAP